ncbi:hypothetical protein QOT74_14290 [Pseudomonas aeruginosa]|uniref:hypothetical protein n=2 Tax=Pseudomonas TaxID=286 RepID=UPI000AE5FEDC|nr:hypothetical protein [Pseudomonas aeruginosa]MCO4013600.1 hypothetical protein [Pseudomonas aeruginosa]HCF3627139.1 hypothetical protein [Pseudomonas aeruginosa]HEJ3806949.1 hypothetical protein [Pseudomonas aeruginosa]HEK0346053.1 hypothetical protein [Pseudomonas aeruginosa]
MRLPWNIDFLWTNTHEGTLMTHHKKNGWHRLPGCLYLALLMSSALAMADGAASRQDEIQEMRTLASSVTANVLIYYNLNGTPYHIGNDEAYRNDMARLLGMATQFDHGDITEQVQNLGAAIAELKNLPQSATAARSTLSAYARWLPPVLDAHAQLDSALGALHDELPPASETRRALHDLSREIGQLLVEYQQASFPYLASVWLPDSQAMIRLDTSVEHRFAMLSARDVHLAQSLKAPIQDYRFVRQRLLTSGQWAPNAVGRYLIRAMQALDTQARGH